MSLAAKEEQELELWKLKLLSRWYSLRKAGRLPNLILSNCYSGGLHRWEQSKLEWVRFGYDELSKEVIDAELGIVRKPAVREDSLLGGEGSIKNLG